MIHHCTVHPLRHTQTTGSCTVLLLNLYKNKVIMYSTSYQFIQRQKDNVQYFLSIHTQTRRSCTVLPHMHTQTRNSCTVLHHRHNQTTGYCTSIILLLNSYKNKMSMYSTSSQIVQKKRLFTNSTSSQFIKK